MFRIEITQIFGRLDMNMRSDLAVGQLLRLLENNTGSFFSTSAFIGIREREDRSLRPFFGISSGFFFARFAFSISSFGGNVENTTYLES